MLIDLVMIQIHHELITYTLTFRLYYHNKDRGVYNRICKRPLVIVKVIVQTGFDVVSCYGPLVALDFAQLALVPWFSANNISSATQ